MSILIGGTCKECGHYRASDSPTLQGFEHAGRCLRMDEYGGIDKRNSAWEWDNCSGGGCHVGPDFGCIHWTAKP